SQIGYGTFGLFANTAKYNARNVLLYDLITAVNAGNLTTNAGENVTFHRNGSLKSSSSSSIVQCLTNCMIISVTNNVAYVGQNNTSNLVDTGIFQTVASGTRYLATNSPSRDAGTTNINATLLVDLGKRTTYPPVSLASSISSFTTLAPA